MRNVEFNIYGGTAVRSKQSKLMKTFLPGLAFLMVLAMSTSAFAQGSIFGTVTNSDVSTPANGEINFVGFLDDTDEELRIESADGAGYDAGNWFDDFQNYLTEAPGNPYDYLFFNTVNGEGFQLSGSIPVESFIQEDIVLAPIGWPAAVTGAAGVTVSANMAVVSWNGVAGLTYHVYRRAATSNGSFFRIDDPSGNLANPGVADSFFVDATVDGVSAYDYLVIAEDGAGNLSPHSAVFTVNTAAVDAPVAVSIDPATGTATGNTLVNVYGSGFDPAGAEVVFGATPITATVLSPYHLTFTTPAGTIGASVDVSVTNTAAATTSNILSGAWVYAANAEPVLAAIGGQSTTENVLLQFTISASDVDGDIPALSTSALPGTAVFVDNLDGTGQLTWTPDFTDAAIYNVTFYATDVAVPTSIDSEVVQIEVLEAGNQTPVMAAVNDTSIAEGGTLALTITATDADGEIPSLSADPLPANAVFVDNADGTGSFTFNPDFTQFGTYNIVFKALDAALEVDSIVVQISVTEVNQLPLLAAIGAQTTTEDVLLSFVISATDDDGTIPVLTTSALPGAATFVDSLNGVGLFEWTPTFAEAGSYDVTFYATDADVGTDVDSETVTITVADGANQTPVLDSIGPKTVAEGDSLIFLITATDADGTIPTLTAENLPIGATFADSLDGTGLFEFGPDFTQSGLFSVTFIAGDGVVADTEIIEITVTEVGNLAPVFDSLGDFAINEGDSLIVTVSATDPDGGGALPILSASTSLNHYTFVDNGDGTGILTYLPDYYDAGVDTVNFFATDAGTPQQSASLASVITTTDINQSPVFDPIGPLAVAAGGTLEFTVTVTDPTDPDTLHTVILSQLGTLANGSFVDNGNNTGTFTFTPDTTQAGLQTASILAVDQGSPQGSATLVVNINVVVNNIPPILDSIGPQTVLEGEDLTILISASDPDGPPPSIDTSGAPENVTFTDNGDGTASLIYAPDFVGGTRLKSLTIKAFDGVSVTKEVVLIQVYDAGNQVPVFDFDPSPTVVEGDSIDQVVSAFDPDGFDIILALDSLTEFPNLSFVDSGNGVGVLTFTPDYTQAGLYDINIFAYDGAIHDPATLIETLTVTFDITEAGNQPPDIADITDRTVAENDDILVTCYATDPDGTFPVLSTSTLPTNAVFTDNGDGTGALNFSPDYTQAGLHPITFYADDGLLTDSTTMTITVTDLNQLPFVFDDGNRTLYEGDTVIYTVTSFDGDGTVPTLTAFKNVEGDSALPANMTFVDNGDLTGTLTFMPDYTQGGPELTPEKYSIVFRATDADYPDVSSTSAPAVFSVINRNQPPTIGFIDGQGPFTANEGETVYFRVVADDGDGSTPPTLSVTGMPDSNATFDYDGTIGEFTFNPDFTQAGSYLITFTVVDELGASISADVQIDIIEAGNQSPSFASEIRQMEDTLHVPVGQTYEIFVSPTDPELDPISIEAFPIIEGASFVDNGDGTAIYQFTADSSYMDSVIEVTFVATDYPAGATDTLVTYSLVVSYLRGDLDDNNKFTMNDIAYLISFLFRDGPSPNVEETADVDGDGSVNIGDVSYLIYYVYYYGPQPPH